VTRLFRGLLGGCLGALSLACGTGPDEALEVGWVCCPHEALQLSLPDTVEPGVPFTVTLETYGNGCYRKGTTEVTQEGDSALIVPLDYRSLTADACDDILLTFEHEALLSFDASGENTVIVRGRGESGTVQDYSRNVWVRE
jgi:hypothetical protein